MVRYEGTWGLYPWGEGHDESMIHPDDLERAKRLPLYGHVFQCVAGKSPYIVLRHDFQDYCVEPSGYRVLPDPKFAIGDRVGTKNTPKRVGIVRAISWHTKRERFMFFMEVDARKSTRTYWDDELEEFAG